MKYLIKYTNAIKCEKRTDAKCLKQSYIFCSCDNPSNSHLHFISLLFKIIIMLEEFLPVCSFTI